MKSGQGDILATSGGSRGGHSCASLSRCEVTEGEDRYVVSIEAK